MQWLHYCYFSWWSYFSWFMSKHFVNILQTFCNEPVCHDYQRIKGHVKACICTSTVFKSIQITFMSTLSILPYASVCVFNHTPSTLEIVSKSSAKKAWTIPFYVKTRNFYTKNSNENIFLDYFLWIHLDMRFIWYCIAKYYWRHSNLTFFEFIMEIILQIRDTLS